MLLALLDFATAAFAAIAAYYWFTSASDHLPEPTNIIDGGTFDDDRDVPIASDIERLTDALRVQSHRSAKGATFAACAAVAQALAAGVSLL
jgi:hypothetical protein